jgi:hypothetical protein
MSSLIDNITLKVLNILKKSPKKPVIMDQYRNNHILWSKYIVNHTPGYIDKQSALSNYLYGYANAFERGHFFNGQFLNASHNSCEVIAVYNALYNLNGYKEEFGFDVLLKIFALNGIVLRGVFGTSPMSIYKFLLNKNYKVGMLKGKKINRDDVMTFSDEYKVFIHVTFNKGQNPLGQIHTMCITKEEWEYKAHNDYEGNKKYPSLYEALIGYKGGAGHSILVIGVRGTQ